MPETALVATKAARDADLRGHSLLGITRSERRNREPRSFAHRRVERTLRDFAPATVDCEVRGGGTLSAERSSEARYFNPSSTPSP